MTQQIVVTHSTCNQSTLCTPLLPSYLLIIYIKNCKKADQPLSDLRVVVQALNDSYMLR